MNNFLFTGFKVDVPCSHNVQWTTQLLDSLVQICRKAPAMFKTCYYFYKWMGRWWLSPWNSMERWLRCFGRSWTGPSNLAYPKDVKIVASHLIGDLCWLPSCKPICSLVLVFGAAIFAPPASCGISTGAVMWVWNSGGPTHPDVTFCFGAVSVAYMNVFME